MFNWLSQEIVTPTFWGYLDEYIDKAHSNVTFTGYVPEIDLCNFFGRAMLR